jgi:glucose-1-phosphate adenylyltransferase
MGVVSVILAGGQGTRLFPLTQLRCKPAVPFGGRYRLIDIPISNSLNSGIENIFIISQYYASDLQQHILETFHMDLFRKGKIEMLCPEETPHRKIWFNGTADAVRQNMEHLLKSSADYFLILSGDQLYNIDLQQLLDCAKRTGADLTIAALSVEEEEARRMGLLKIDAKHYVTSFVEKPQERAILDQFQQPGTSRYLGSMGIYVFKRHALEALLKESGDDFGHHLIPLEVKRGKAAAYIYDGYWEDIGTVGSYYRANLALIKGKHCLDTYDESHPIYARLSHLPSPLIKDTRVHDSFISEGSIIEAKEVSRSIIGLRSHIKKGTVLRDSILLGNRSYQPPAKHTPSFPPAFYIGENCVIEKTIVDEHVMIGNDVQLINREKRTTFDGNGIYIRDGIIIVTTGTHLPDGFVL